MKFRDHFTELWKLGGPVAVVLGVAGTVLIGEGIRYLYFSEVADDIATAQIANSVPFFVQVYGVLILGAILIAIGLAYYLKMKQLEQEKDIMVIEALASLTNGSRTLLEATPENQKGGIISVIQQNLATTKVHLDKIVEKSYHQ